MISKLLVKANQKLVQAEHVEPQITAPPQNTIVANKTKPLPKPRKQAKANNVRTVVETVANTTIQVYMNELKSETKSVATSNQHVADLKMQLAATADQSKKQEVARQIKSFHEKAANSYTQVKRLIHEIATQKIKDQAQIGDSGPQNTRSQARSARNARLEAAATDAVNAMIAAQRLKDQAKMAQKREVEMEESARRQARAAQKKRRKAAATEAVDAMFAARRKDLEGKMAQSGTKEQRQYSTADSALQQARAARKKRQEAAATEAVDAIFTSQSFQGQPRNVAQQVISKNHQRRLIRRKLHKRRQVTELEIVAEEAVAANPFPI
jgi:hypothetical protein